MAYTKKEAEVSETGIVAEARAWVDPGIYTGFKPFDQRARIPHYYTANWREALSPEELEERAMAIQAWELGHGHDTRLKCYPEFQCQAVEGYAHYLIDGLLKKLELVSETSVTAVDVTELRELLDRVEETAEGDSSDDEIQALQEALSHALGLLDPELDVSETKTEGVPLWRPDVGFDVNNKKGTQS